MTERNAGMAMGQKPEMIHSKTGKKEKWRRKEDIAKGKVRQWLALGMAMWTVWTKIVL